MIGRLTVNRVVVKNIFRLNRSYLQRKWSVILKILIN